MSSHEHRPILRTMKIPLAWLQLIKEKLRLAVAVGGVTFAVILIFMQLGFRAAMLESAVRYHRTFRYDLVMISPRTEFIGVPASFSRRRLYQALGDSDVESASAVYLEQARWRNPWKYNTRPIVVVGVDPSEDVIDVHEVAAQLSVLQLPDIVLFDAASRPEFGPVGEAFEATGPFAVELNDRKVTVSGLFHLGTSFGIDGSVVTSDLNFRRVFPRREPGLIDLGLITLRPGSDPWDIQSRLTAALEKDVLILTPEQFIARERFYWETTTPIGFVFGFGAIMGLIVGGVIVYQILFADVSDHLAEYATLKAMGYSNRHLFSVVLQEAAILAVLGFVPGLLLTLQLYRITAEAIRQPMAMTVELGIAVLALTFAMCGLAAAIALNKIRTADPAEIF